MCATGDTVKWLQTICSQITRVLFPRQPWNNIVITFPRSFFVYCFSASWDVKRRGLIWPSLHFENMSKASVHPVFLTIGWKTLAVKVQLGRTSTRTLNRYTQFSLFVPILACNERDYSWKPSWIDGIWILSLI